MMKTSMKGPVSLDGAGSGSNRRLPGVSKRTARPANLYLVPVILYATLIFYISSLASPPEPMGQQIVFASITIRTDIVEHMLLYFIFGLLLFFWANRAQFTHGITVTLCSAIGMFYALTDEIHQIYSGRIFDYADLVADFLGIAIALMICSGYLCWNYSNKKRSSI